MVARVSFNRTRYCILSGNDRKDKNMSEKPYSFRLSTRFAQRYHKSRATVILSTCSKYDTGKKRFFSALKVLDKEENKSNLIESQKNELFLLGLYCFSGIKHFAECVKLFLRKENNVPQDLRALSIYLEIAENIQTNGAASDAYAWMKLLKNLPYDVALSNGICFFASSIASF